MAKSPRATSSRPVASVGGFGFGGRPGPRFGRLSSGGLSGSLRPARSGLCERGARADKSCYHNGGNATLHHHEPPEELVVFWGAWPSWM